MTADPGAWIALRKAVREADRLGARFRVVGADVDIDGDLPERAARCAAGADAASVSWSGTG